GHVFCPEPFQRLVNQGMILGEATFYPVNALGSGAHAGYSEDQVVHRAGRFCLKSDGSVEVVPRAEKMSKSRGNVVNPDDVVERYGADSLRLYEMFMGPLEATKPWSMRGVEGVYRFLSRVWRLFIDDRAESVVLNDSVQDVEPDRETLRELHRTVQKITEDLDAMRFNTAITAMMEYSNHLTRLK